MCLLKKCYIYNACPANEGGGAYGCKQSFVDVICLCIFFQFSIGGYDTGAKAMVATVEVSEPRMSSWMMVEPMNYTRGYHSSAVLGGSIFTFGGVKGEADTILDVVSSNAKWQISYRVHLAVNNSTELEPKIIHPKSCI